MCGIIGIVGGDNVAPIILDSLRRLEYRGYDSAGIAVVNGAGIKVCRSSGKLDSLCDRLLGMPIVGRVGIGHTRWATHGEPIEKNAHPHSTDHVAVVHNGIIENYLELRRELEGYGCQFGSDTDSEVVVQYATWLLTQGKTPDEAVKETLARLQGQYALAFIFRDHDDLMYAARMGCPLVVGHGTNGALYLGSDPVALAALTSQVSFLEDGDYARLTSKTVEFFDESGRRCERVVHRTSVNSAAVEKNGFPHFMLKEIHEQPDAVAATLLAYVDPVSGLLHLPPLPFDLADIERITVVACGTAHYAGAVARYWFEDIAGIPVDVEIASEFRYRNVVMPKKGLVICVSQSGETADTLAALRFAKEQRGQKVISVINVVESSIARQSDAIFPTLAGPEIGVASTKAFTTQLVVLACLAIYAARCRGVIGEDEERSYLKRLSELPGKMQEALCLDGIIKEVAEEQIAAATDALFLGRGASYIVAMEGALKLKEISYIHAEGYPAGEMKHGPIALITNGVPIIGIAPSDFLFEKTASNLHEAKARSGRIILITDRYGYERLGDSATASIVLPDTDRLTAPVVYSVAVQLLAYHTAVLRNLDVDKPRNLAKSVTVE